MGNASNWKLDNSPDAYVPCDPATQSCGFMVGPNSDYLAGHIVVFMVALMNVAVPPSLYFFWKLPQFESAEDQDGRNKEYEMALKWIGIGMLANYGPAVLMWPFTFLFENYYQIAYMCAWGYPGFIGGFIVAIASLVYFILAFTKHKDMVKDDKVEIGVTLAVVMVWDTLMGFLAWYFMYDSLIYMLPRTMKAYWDERGNSGNSGIAYDY